MNPVVAEWVAKADGDHATAERELAARERPNLDAVCFHAQQCVEKLMKALLIARGAPAPRTHDLVELNELVTRAVPGWSCPLTDLRALTLGAVHFRYPGSSASEPDAREALAICRRLRTPLLALVIA